MKSRIASDALCDQRSLAGGRSALNLRIALYVTQWDPIADFVYFNPPEPVNMEVSTERHEYIELRFVAVAASDTPLAASERQRSEFVMNE